MYGAIPKGSLAGGITDTIREYNSAGTFAANDLAMIDGSTGEVVVATAGSRLMGVALEAATSASTGVAINITPWLLVLMDNDNDTETFAATHIGEWGNFIGGTGAMQVDSNTLSTTVAQLMCVEYNPQGHGYDSDTSIGIFMISESMWCSTYTE
jgi:hypothetical protein